MIGAAVRRYCGRRKGAVSALLVVWAACAHTPDLPLRPDLAPPLLIALTRMTGFLLPNAPALKLDNADFSSDPANEAAMDRDPWIEQGGAPAKTAAGLVEGMHAIWRDVDRLTMPVFAIHGEA